MPSAILWDGKQLHGLNASGRAPAGLDAGLLQAQVRRDATTRPSAAGTPSPCPGAVAGWVALSERFGKLPFADLMEPAIEIAERGYLRVPTVVQHKWAAATPELQGLPGFAQAFMPWGRAPTWASCSSSGGCARPAPDRREQRRGLYGGEIAEAIEPKFSRPTAAA
jgi:gamma-glutamyltranspeptidase/glutathione hydrolase